MNHTGTNSSDIKQQNLSAILLTLLHQEEISRSQLAQQIGVATSTVTNLVGELIAPDLSPNSALCKPTAPRM